MGGFSSKCSAKLAKRIIWCDTEGGVRNVPLWDISCLEETAAGISGYRLCNVRDATKRGRAMLKKELDQDVYADGLKTGSTSVVTLRKQDGKWLPTIQTAIDLPLVDLLKSYIKDRAGSVMVAWNMNGHDRHVLRRAVGDELDHVTTWDALPWFRSVYSLPKNTMSSCKPGTPRAVFGVPTHGVAHSSLSDAVHMRAVVTRAAYCAGCDPVDTAAHRGESDASLFAAVCREIDDSNLAREWQQVAVTAWLPGLIPATVLGT